VFSTLPCLPGQAVHDALAAHLARQCIMHCFLHCLAWTGSA
jgi:hypothetical protein